MYILDFWMHEASYFEIDNTRLFQNCRSISLQRKLCERVAACSPRVWSSFLPVRQWCTSRCNKKAHVMLSVSVYWQGEPLVWGWRPAVCGRQCNLYFLSPPGCVFKIDFPFASSLVPLVLLLPNAGTRLHGATSPYLVVSQLPLLLWTPGWPQPRSFLSALVCNR